VTMRPSSRLKDGAQKGMPGRPTLGLTNGRSLEFGKPPTESLPLLGPDLTNISYVEHVRHEDGNSEDKTVTVEEFADLQAAMRRHATLDFKLSSKLGKGDKLVAVNGQPVTNYADVQRLLAISAGKPIELTIQRAPKKEDKTKAGDSAEQTPERYALTVRPRPAVDYGIVMQATPITAVQKDSPAANAGLVVGDKLLSFAGEPIGDPLSFPQRTLAKVGEMVEIEVERGEEGKKEPHKLTVELRPPPQAMWSGNISSTVAVETLGIAYDVTAKVAQVREGGPAADRLLPGDEILSVKFLAAGPAQEAVEGSLYRKAAIAKEEIKLDGKATGWPGVIAEASVQRMRDTTLQVTVKRGQEEIKQKLLPADSTELYIEDLSLPFGALTEKHEAANVGEALSLGAREVKERMTEVFTVVKKLVTFRISATNLGGPLAIIGQATSEAESGISDLLMFFTFLSANLAVINFLPIPALDGGHMVFLAYEGIRRKPVDENLQMRLSAAGILSLLALMLFVTMLDVYRIFG
jgi:regulator of sigma E protease